MSDLQVSLLIIGLVVVGGVVAFNWLQQWRLRRRLESALGEKHEDVLLRDEAPHDRARRAEPQHAGADRVEPTLGVPAAAAPAEYVPQEQHLVLAATLPPVPGFDPMIDFVVSVDAAEPI